MQFHVPNQSVLSFFLLFGCHMNQEIKPRKVRIMRNQGMGHLSVQLGQFVNGLQKLPYKFNLFLAEGYIRYTVPRTGIHVSRRAAGVEILYILGHPLLSEQQALQC